MPRGVVWFDAMAIVAHEAVLRLALARQVAAGEVDHALHIVQVVRPHRLNVQPASVQSREELVACVLDPAAIRHAVRGVVLIHDFPAAGQRAVGAGIADGGHEEREIAGAVREDAQVAFDLLPENAQAVAPSEELRKSVVR